MADKTLKIAMLCINIGDYTVFWDEFYKSAEKNFMPESQKNYYVFTDKEINLTHRECKNINCIYQDDLGWPYNTMKRFHMFRSIINRLESYDYIFFANANALFSAKITSDILDENKDFIVVEHPGYHFKSNDQKPFERRKESNAYVAMEQGIYYVQGAFYGAKKTAFIEMVNLLDELTEKDLKKNIVALWHDESFLNMFVSKNIERVQVLGWQYLYFEERVFPYKPVIMLRDKRKYITNKNGRFKNQNYFKEYAMIYLRNIKWKFMIFVGLIKWQKNVENFPRYAGRDITKVDN